KPLNPKISSPLIPSAKSVPPSFHPISPSQIRSRWTKLQRGFCGPATAELITSRRWRPFWTGITLLWMNFLMRTKLFRNAKLSIVAL
ncbi:hypothetical protein VIGAN_09070700, partial [Vigna angularis var. angularis]